MAIFTFDDYLFELYCEYTLDNADYREGTINGTLLLSHDSKIKFFDIFNNPEFDNLQFSVFTSYDKTPLLLHCDILYIENCGYNTNLKLAFIQNMVDIEQI